MAYIDAENTLVAPTTLTSSVQIGDFVDLGSKGGFVHPLYVDVKLTEKMTSGKVDSVTLQSSANEAFSSPADEVQVTVPSSVPQTADTV